MKKIVSIVVLLCMIFSAFTLVANASDNPNELEDEVIQAATLFTDIPAKSAILMDAVTGKILFEKNPDEKMPPASITKIMTMLLVMEALDQGKINLKDMVTTSELASSMGGTQIWLAPNEQMSVHDMLKSCAVASANDAAVALGEHIGGSMENFVAMMNDKAGQLGMTNTTFINPTGLDAEGHLTTAKDIALMSKALLSYPKITEYTSIWMDSVRGGQMELVNTNKLVKFYKGCTGLKTGTTDGAGSCLSASATRGNLSLIAVVMGCTTSVDRFNSTKQLLDYGFNNFAMYKTNFSKDMVKPIPVKKGVTETVELDTTNYGDIIIPKGSEKDIKEIVNLPESVTAPIEQGQKLGDITLSLNDEVIATFDITAKHAVPAVTFTNALQSLLSGILA